MTSLFTYQQINQEQRPIECPIMTSASNLSNKINKWRYLLLTIALVTQCCYHTHAFQLPSALHRSSNAPFASRPTFSSSSTTTTTSSSSSLQVHTLRDADMVELMVGGERYENVPMPDAMKPITLYVGNLCEFVHDEDLSHLFQAVSQLQSVPACVVRKADTTSLRYGFVSFLSVEEKEQAIIRFNNYEWRGKRLKVQEIKDTHKNGGEVRIPERMVNYVTGGKKLKYESKKKMAASNIKNKKSNNNNHGRKATNNKGRTKVQRISRGDVDRLQPQKNSNNSNTASYLNLNDKELAELDRAARKGFLTVVGKQSKKAPLINIHRQWCDSRSKPQIILYKALGGGAIDRVVVDLSPLRLHAMMLEQQELTSSSSSSPLVVEDYMVKWKAQAMTAALEAGMETTYLEGDNYIDDGDELGDNYDDAVPDTSSVSTMTLENTSAKEWATKPIWQLPVVSLGVFEGERSKAKAMTKVLGKLWEIPDEEGIQQQQRKSRKATRNNAASTKKAPVASISSSSRGKNYRPSRTKSVKDDKRRQRRRSGGGGNHQAW